MGEEGEEVRVAWGAEKFVGEGLAVFEARAGDFEDCDGVGAELLDDFF